MHSLFPRLTIAFVVVALVSVFIVGLSAGNVVQREFGSYLKRGPTGLRLATAAFILSSYHEEHGGWEGVSATVEAMAASGEGRLVLADPDGAVVADSDNALVGKHIAKRALQMATPIQDRKQVVGFVYFQPDEQASDTGPLGAMGRLMRRGSQGSERRSDASHSASTTVNSQPTPDDAGGSAEPLSVGPAEISFLRALSDSLWLAALSAVAIAVFLSVFFAHQITNPLRRLTAAAQHVARGDLSQRVDVRSKDEIGELASAFNAMADQLERNEQSRRHMVADVAHELNTPLAVIRGNLEAMLDGVVPLTPDQISSIHEESIVLSRLITDLRDLSLAEAGQLKLQLSHEDVSSLARRAVERFQNQAQAKGVEVRVAEDAGDLPSVIADGDRIVQVISNLLGNALRHTPDGGAITVSVRTDASQSRSRAVEVIVTDTGSGIPADSLVHVFDRFYRADRSRSRATGGSGLGLAIVQQLVQAHGGRVWAESEDGRGSAFHFTLPTYSGTHPAIKPG